MRVLPCSVFFRVRRASEGAEAPPSLALRAHGLRPVGRPAATLVEVLVAIFVMALGMLALLVLFPLGILRMAQAIQDDHVAHAAANANALAAMKDIRVDPDVVYYKPPVIPLPPPPTWPPWIDVFKFPGGALPAAHDGARSYPVLVDPVGFITAAATDPNAWVPVTSTNTIRRRTVSFATTSNVLRWFTFLDDILFDGATGRPKVTAPNKFDRDLRYSWAYLCQRPKTGDPTVVDLTVLVYKNRPLVLNAGLGLDEFFYASPSDIASNGATVEFDTNTNVIRINYGATLNPPPVKAGDWIMDISYVSFTEIPPPPLLPATYGFRHGHCYRVVGISDLGGNIVELEVATPFRGFPEGYIPPTFPGSGIYLGSVLILDGVVEVFEKGIGRHRFGINAY